MIAFIGVRISWLDVGQGVGLGAGGAFRVVLGLPQRVLGALAFREQRLQLAMLRLQLEVLRSRDAPCARLRKVAASSPKASSATSAAIPSRVAVGSSASRSPSSTRRQGPAGSFQATAAWATAWRTPSISAVGPCSANGRLWEWAGSSKSLPNWPAAVMVFARCGVAGPSRLMRQPGRLAASTTLDGDTSSAPA